jgi:hypothetical protein
VPVNVIKLEECRPARILAVIHDCNDFFFIPLIPNCVYKVSPSASLDSVCSGKQFSKIMEIRQVDERKSLVFLDVVFARRYMRIYCAVEFDFIWSIFLKACLLKFLDRI